MGVARTMQRKSRRKKVAVKKATAKGGSVTPIKKTNGAGVSEVEQAKEVLQAEIQRKIEACQEEINATLKKYTCTFEVQTILTAQRIDHRVGIKPAVVT